MLIKKLNKIIMKKNVAVIIGSLRKESYNRKIAKELIRIAPETLKLSIIEIGNLNLYNEDLEENEPETWQVFRQEIAKSDALLWISPEYNRSIPGVLKNAIDVASRPPKKNVLMNKPAAVITASSSGIGGFGANHAIRQSLVFSRVKMLPNEIYFSEMDKSFKDDGRTLTERSEKYLLNFLDAFSKWMYGF